MSQTAIEDTKPWPPLKKALWDVVTKARINGKYVAAFPFVDELYAAALAALSTKLQEPVGDGKSAQYLYALTYLGMQPEDDPEDFACRLSDRLVTLKSKDTKQ